MTIFTKPRRSMLVSVRLAGVVVGFLQLSQRFGLAQEKEPLFPPGGPRLPLGLPPIIWPSKNKYTPEKAELGWFLFFDKRLSADHTLSCAQLATSRRMALRTVEPCPLAFEVKRGCAAPTLFNCAWIGDLFWDGRSKLLEKQMIGPLTNPIEMGNSDKDILATLVRHPGLRCRFKKVFGEDKITIEQVAKAMATFERTIVSGNSAYDRFKAGDKTALTELQQEGMETFFSSKARCDSCHEGLNFTNGKYANIGFGMDKPNPDLGSFQRDQTRRRRGRLQDPDVARDCPHRPLHA